MTMKNCLANALTGLIRWARLPFILTLVVSLIGSFCTLAMAQERAQETDKEEVTRDYKVQLEEVLVTAQKREENYMTVPLTVTAFTADDMANTGVTSIQGISDFIPGIEIGGENGNSTQVGITVRGVSSPNISSGGDPSTATFYDSSYMPRAVASIPFSDIARTEVLKGPQGTLFGRNATVGVLNIVPNSPHDEFEGFVKTRLGSYNLLRVEGMLNLPITDSLAFRGNIFSNQRDGFVEQKGIGKDVRDRSFMAARMSLKWAISDNTSLQFSADIEDRDEQPRAAIGVGKYALDGSVDPFSGETAHDVVGQEETRDMYGVAVKLDHAINDQWSLFAVLSYRDWDTTNLEEEDGTPEPRRYFDTNNIEDSNIVYTEWRVNYVGDRVNAIAGVNYSSEDVFQRTDIHLTADSYMQFLTPQVAPSLGLTNPGQDDHLWDLIPDEATYMLLTDGAGLAVLPPSFAGVLLTENMDNSGDFTNWGLFGDLTYQLTDTLRLSAGVRYSRDDKTYSWQTFESNLDWSLPQARVAYFPGETGATGADQYNKFSASESWSKVTGRLVGDWTFAEQAMTYLSYSTGYKSGGYDGQSFQAFVAGPYEPEEIASIEWGIKADFFNNSLRVEAALFHHELDDRQTTVTAKSSPEASTAQPTVISGDEDADGIELIVQWNPLENLRLTALSTYRETDSMFDTYFNAAGDVAGGIRVSGETNTEYTLRFDWAPGLPSGSLLVHVDYVYREVSDPTVGTAIFQTGPWYFQDTKRLNARISWQNDAATIEAALWGQNLLDEETASNPGGFVASELGAAHTNIDDPLNYGIDFRYSF